MKKLYMITLGGKAKGAKIEVHDVQFIIAKDINETYSILKENWYGIDLKLHLDSYKVINGIDSYDVSIKDKPIESDNYLYFVNIGAYDKSLLNEIHYYKLVIAKDINRAKKRALSHIPDRLIDIHIDNISRIDKSTLLNKLYKGFILLTPSDKEYDLKPDWFGYKRIDND